MKKTALLLSLLLTISLLSSCAPNDNSDNGNGPPPPDTATEQSTGTSPTIPPVSEETPPAETFTLPESNDITSSRYGYYTLTADEKSVYDQIVEAAESFVPVIKLDRRLPKKSVDKICQLIYLEENELFYVLGSGYEMVSDGETGLTHTINLTFLDKEEALRQSIAVEERLTEITDKIQPWMATIDILKLFHDEVILGCKYDLDGEYRNTAYGALVDGKALCEGYARAFAMLCNKQGIENLYGTGTVQHKDGNNEEHMWNMVKLQGYWYNMDLTWDDPNSLPDSSIQFESDFICYNYFLYPNYMFGKTMILSDKLFTLPEATSMNLNYFVYYGSYARSYDEATEILSKKIHRAFEKKQKYVHIRFSSQALYDESYVKLFEDPSREIFSTTISPSDLRRIGSYPTSEIQSIVLILFYD